MTLSNYSYQLVWTRNLLNKASFNVSTSYIYNDNLGLLFQKPNSIQEKHFKYIVIYYDYIRDLIEDKQVKPYHIDEKKNPANILTKNLSQVLFSYFHSFLGLEILQAHLSRSLMVDFILFSLVIFILLYFTLLFSFSIFRTTRVRVYQSRCHISHKLMVQSQD